MRYDRVLINNRYITDKYTLSQRNKFDALQKESEVHTTNDKYKNFVNTHLEAAAECIPTKQRGKSTVPWETLAVIEKRADMKTASKSNRRNSANINALKHKNAQNELANIYLKLKKNTIHTK